MNGALGRFVKGIEYSTVRYEHSISPGSVLSPKVAKLSILSPGSRFLTGARCLVVTQYFSFSMSCDLFIGTKLSFFTSFIEKN